MKKPRRGLVGPLLVLLVFCAVLWMLHRELRQYPLSDFLDGLARIPAEKLALAVALTIFNHCIFVGYDLLGIRYIQRSVRLSRIALGAFLGYAVGHNLGTLLGGATVRYRLYTAWGLSAVDVVKLLLILGVTFWAGVCVLAGFAFLAAPLEIPARLHLPAATTQPLGLALAAAAIGYLTLCAVWRSPLRIGKWRLSLPPLWLSLLQCSVATLDLTVAASVLYTLLPPSVEISFVQFLGIYVLAQVASLTTQIPGGLGVIELAMLVLLRPADPQGVVGALLAFRLIYYLAPLAIAMALLISYEFALSRGRARRTVEVLSLWADAVAPRLVALGVFLSGAVLLLWGAVPVSADRRELIERLLPPAVVISATVLGGVAAMLLTFLARGLQRRVRTAYPLALALLWAGAVCALAKNLAYGQAILLLAAAAVLPPCRRYFFRRQAGVAERFPASWIAAATLLLACTIWLSLASLETAEGEAGLGPRLVSSDGASGPLQAAAGAVLAALVFSAATWRRWRRRSSTALATNDLDAIAQVVAQSPRTSAHLALLGDKRFLANPNRTAFLMYAVHGRSWVSIGDPVGPEQEGAELAWEFRERSEQSGGRPVFYLADRDRLPLYLDLGLTPIEIGEAARISLASFDMNAPSRASLRSTIEQLADDGRDFEVVEPEHSATLLETLQQVSDAWRRHSGVPDRGFSVASPQPDYLRRIPLALLRRRGTLIAFAGLWRGAHREEAAADMIRYLPDSPPGVMETLLVQLMLWARDQGYAWFDLGMAPLTDPKAQPLAPLRDRIADLAYRHGEHFRSPDALRQFAQQFGPAWRPKYLASPGGFALPTILADVAQLAARAPRKTP